MCESRGGRSWGQRPGWLQHGVGWGGRGSRAQTVSDWETRLCVWASFQVQWKATGRVLSEGQPDGTWFYFEMVRAQMCGPVIPQGVTVYQPPWDAF